MGRSVIARSERDRALETIVTRIEDIDILITGTVVELEALRNERADLCMARYILENTKVVDFPTGDPQ